MESRSFITVSRPPAELFEESALGLQESEFEAVQGELFDRMEYPPEGGVYAHYYDHPYPTKGQPYPAAVDAILAPKKFIMGVASIARRHFLLVGTFFFLPGFMRRYFMKSIIDCYVEPYVMSFIKPHIFSHERHRPAVQELRRAGFKTIDTLNNVHADIRRFLRLFWTMFTEIMEWDNAHCYRGQDVFGELGKSVVFLISGERFDIEREVAVNLQEQIKDIDGARKIRISTKYTEGEKIVEMRDIKFVSVDHYKKEFIKNPAKGVARLAAVEVSRERGWLENKGRYRLMGSVLHVFFLLSPFLRRLAREFITELDIDKVKLDEADEYHNLLRPDYDIHGWPIEFRQKKWSKIFGEYSSKNAERIEEGRRRRKRIEAAADTMRAIEREDGTPFLVFFVVPSGTQSMVKMLETRFSRDTPALKEACFQILQGNGKSSEELTLLAAKKEKAENKDGGT